MAFSSRMRRDVQTCDVEDDCEGRHSLTHRIDDDTSRGGSAEAPLATGRLPLTMAREVEARGVRLPRGRVAGVADFVAGRAAALARLCR